MWVLWLYASAPALFFIGARWMWRASDPRREDWDECIIGASLVGLVLALGAPVVLPALLILLITRVVAVSRFGRWLLRKQFPGKDLPWSESN